MDSLDFQLLIARETGRAERTADQRGGVEGKISSDGPGELKVSG